MAATNLPELLDPALTRPGRFDRQVRPGLCLCTSRRVRGRQAGLGRVETVAPICMLQHLLPNLATLLPAPRAARAVPPDRWR